MPTQNKTTPRRVSFATEPQDFECILYAEFGMSTKFISEKTGLTTGQAQYRISKVGAKRANYRNGTSLGSRMVMQHARGMIGYTLEQSLKERFKS